jgi:predicted transposase YbfD/YdcC
VEIEARSVEELRKSFCGIHDQRRQSGNLRHNLVDILVIAFSALLCGLRDYEDMESLGREKEQWLRGFLELPNGIPDKNTFQRVFTWIDPQELLKSLHGWVWQSGAEGRRLNIDGKTMRGSADGEENPARHVVSAWIGENRLSLGQVKTEEKSNDITAIPELLDLIDIEGSTVSIDAMGCQKAIAKKIVEKKAKYVLAVKENHPQLYRQIEEYFDWVEKEGPKEEPVERWDSGLEKNHGRLERRQVWVSSNIGWLDPASEWEGLRCIIACRRSRLVKGEQTVFDRYYISSLEAEAHQAGVAVRGHWSVENQLHWVLDVVFGEDADRKRKNNAPENLNVLRKAALASLKRGDPQNKSSFRRLMFKALMNDDYRTSLLFGS